MKPSALPLLAAAFVMSASGAALAQTRTKTTNPDNLPPGQMMQNKGSVKGSPGASGYTPGHEMKMKTSTRAKRSPGASSYAPGHEPAATSTTTSTRSHTRSR